MKNQAALLVASLLLTSLAQAAFVCTASVVGTKASVQLASNVDEPYMADGTLNGYSISTYQNEDGVSYSVSVTKANRLIVSSTIPFYEDANLQFANGKGLIAVQCTK